MIDWAGEEKKEEDFHKFRSKGIGSSDIPIILGLSPWKTPFKLWLEKTGIKKDNFAGNWATQRGIELEPKVRDWYNKKFNTNMIVERRVHPDYPIFRANADGFDNSINELIEIKCPGADDHRKALSKIIPEKYYPQCQWLMMVFQCERINYISFNDGKEFNEHQHYAIVKLDADPDYQKMIQGKASNFWNKVLTRQSPSEKESLIEDEEIKGLLTQYSNLKKEIEIMNIRLNEISDKIQHSLSTDKGECENFKIGWITRKGTIDYKAIPELKSVDLEKYRKKESRYFSIKEIKQD